MCVPYVQPNHAKAQLWFTVGYPFKSSQLVKYPYMICINIYYIYILYIYILLYIYYIIYITYIIYILYISYYYIYTYVYIHPHIFVSTIVSVVALLVPP